MASFVDTLVVGCVTGDAVDLFVPSVTISMYYGAKQGTNGCIVKPSLYANPPKVTFSNGHPNQLYTLEMVDPDAPSPSEPSMKELVHWFVTSLSMDFLLVNFSLYFPERAHKSKVSNSRIKIIIVEISLLLLYMLALLCL